MPAMRHKEATLWVVTRTRAPLGSAQGMLASPEPSARTVSGSTGKRGPRRTAGVAGLGGCSPDGTESLLRGCQRPKAGR